MKKLSFVLLLTLLVAATLSSCRTHKGCKGNGSWYGHRNLAETPSQDSILVISNFKLCDL
jgi:hypothetical protein